MNVELKYCNGKSKNGICCGLIDVNKLKVKAIYKEFDRTYFEKVKINDIIIIFEGYPIDEFMLDKLRRDLNDGNLERWMEFDVYFRDEWEELVSLKRKFEEDIETSDMEPKRKKRKFR